MTTPSDYILVVDDMNFMQLLLGNILKHLGHNVRTAPDGHTALRIIEQRPPKAIFLDLNLPGDHGTEVCRAIRHIPGMAKVPIIICTAQTTRDMVEQSIAAGATDFLCKPITPAIVNERLKKHLPQP